MKSLIEESSSIAKAIEKGWERAGKPHSFSVKVFELPEKNFLGMTTKYAKIGIFFTEERVSTGSTKKESSFVSSQQTTHQKKQPQEQQTRQQSAPLATNRPQQRKKNSPVVEVAKVQAQPIQKQEPTIIWTDDMTFFVTEWLKKSLHLMSFTEADFVTSALKNHLKIQFNKPLTHSSVKQTQLFRGLSYLIMASLRAKFKTDLKGLRVLLTCE